MSVKGVVTDTIYLCDCGDGSGQKCYAAGWYNSGKAYYWRKFVLEQTVNSVLTALAAHEVCHAKFYGHGAAHTQCTNELTERMQ